ncbi:acyl transferase/acyl hydrolase/lysophospholipase [Biscogniauxia marginata]|nr:acyl transferase/acyl hydrolase/lysophospholipase [Biscogniauxia marginata]
MNYYPTTLANLLMRCSWHNRVDSLSSYMDAELLRRKGVADKSRSTLRQGQIPRGFFSLAKQQQERKAGTRPFTIATVIFILGGLLIYPLYPDDESRRTRLVRSGKEHPEAAKKDKPCQGKETAWAAFANRFEDFSNVTDIEWSTFSDRIVDLILPDWSKGIPSHIRKLQRELSTSDGSLANQIWHEAHNPFINPEIQYSAKVRVSDQLCDEEKEYLARRKKVVTMALAKYLDLDESDVHPDDVPTISVCGSGGGLRALVAGTGSLLATQEDGLYDCVTYTSGVSGSCWLQAIYNSSLTHCRLDRIVDHMKARLGVHIAYPPTALSAVTTSPTNKLLLSSMVEKLKGDPNADFGLVDVYGILLSARLLVPKGELGVNDRDFKLSNQRDYIKFGQNPMPIYTAVRHEIPDITSTSQDAFSEEIKAIAKQEAWFQWFEMTPYEVFCEEFGAGIPTWALGRRFNDGADVQPESGFHLPELRMPILMGIFGSAFCATLSHYYREVRPLVKSLTGFGTIDEMIHGRNEDLEKVHPIDPAQIPNFTYNMEGKLRFTTPTTVYKNKYLQLMDAGMSNNLPIYPLLRPGRDVDVIVAFDASADVKTDNWLAVVDGYARQRGVKGWPVGVGWPRAMESSQEIQQQLDAARADTPLDAQNKLEQAQQDQKAQHVGETPTAAAATARSPDTEQKDKAKHDVSNPEDSDLGYCTIWVGTTEERSSEPPPPSKALTDETTWQLMEPNAGIAVVYLPFLANPKVPGVDPAASDYLSTWNFVYTPEQIDRVVALARANFDEGKGQIRRCVRAVYERKKKAREQHEEQVRKERYRRLVRLGIAGKLGEGDHFS